MERSVENNLDILKEKHYYSNIYIAEKICYYLNLLSINRNTKYFNKNIRLAREWCSKSIGTHTKEQWDLLLSILNYKCCCCGCTPIGRPTKDHIIPIHCGGSDLISNLQPLCRECNTANKDCLDYRPDWLIDIVGGCYCE